MKQNFAYFLASELKKIPDLTPAWPYGVAFQTKRSHFSKTPFPPSHPLPAIHTTQNHHNIFLYLYPSSTSSTAFLKSEARLKLRCGQVTPGVLADVERLFRQLRGNLNINGQCTVSNLKRVLMDQGLCSNGPKAELVQRVHNYINLIREAKGLPVDAAEVAHMEEVM